MSLILRFLNLLWLFVYFLWDLLVSSLLVARAVLSPRDITKPRLVTIPLNVKSDAGITMVANFITLTPGTLTVDVSDDRSTLLVHDLLAGDSGDGTRQAVREGIESRVLKVTLR
ncbi:MAG TPA: Na+/H+ antiporter subunit E [Amaricoccus sp.]|uniref:Na+/H+ antiporter subunit E n=1 Tax=Amaricoccus sp. TaxID=1872485 RepID=UPI002C5773BE|nr:Na+/H+ antiporter subunit E [Amaricoccus sp.]HMQ94306.1 Na+/H+ antiporter subunit E [Amaricoccus sp.]HMR53970.1 Na+/H+ antiporter subunit E [Amaricoccus sp.]HMR60954.1 Na+/H+ antiporter subunit E [Amaricoccus sp.]HMU00966.1 Na+/H+ antiporter subunit E [Amaricoccus sp.]